VLAVGDDAGSVVVRGALGDAVVTVDGAGASVAAVGADETALVRL
jgi:hypothetical protein